MSSKRPVKIVIAGGGTGGHISPAVAVFEVLKTREPVEVLWIGSHKGAERAAAERAGIPFAALVAERMGLPMTYVRKKPKGYGRNARIEGAMREGQRVLLVEELTTDGGADLETSVQVAEIALERLGG